MSFDRPVLTTKDYMILEAMLELAIARGDPLVRLLRLKLSNASVVLPTDIDPDVVTLNSRVSFRVDGEPSHTRIVIRDEKDAVSGLTIPITIPRGLALLGMRPGFETHIDPNDESSAKVQVEAVPYQPEAHQRQVVGKRPPHKVGTLSGTVFGRETLETRRKSAARTPRKANEFDPGPSAA
jgi:regulator of nucleoside diphosphate kinase